MWRAAGRPLRVARPALPREALPPRPKRTEEGTRPSAEMSRASASTSASSFPSPPTSDSSIVFVVPSCSANAGTEVESSPIFSSPSVRLSSPWSSVSDCCSDEDCRECVDTSSSPSALPSVSRGRHGPRSKLAPSPQRRSKPPIPLLVTAKKYSFGYA